MLLLSYQAHRNLLSSQSVANTKFGLDNHLASLLETMTVEQRQCFLCIMQQNRDLMQSMNDMKTLLQNQVTLPPQILLQQPVFLLDAFGKVSPFHLEFIDSSECFIAVMKARFSNAGVKAEGLSKLDNLEFVVEDTRRKKSVDLSKPWDRVFRPGQQVDMRMIFHRFACPPNTCPSCLELNEDDPEQVQCQNCGLFYQNIQAISKSSRDWSTYLPPDEEIPLSGDDIPYILRHPSKAPELKVFRPVDEVEDELFEGYTRIQIVSQPLALLDSRFPALQLIEDFCRFAQLLQDVPPEISQYRSEIEDLHARASKFVSQRDSSFPAFSSFSQIEQMRTRLTIESLTLRHYIGKLN